MRRPGQLSVQTGDQGAGPPPLTSAAVSTVGVVQMVSHLMCTVRVVTWLSCVV